MRLTPTPIPGVFEVDSPDHTDARGGFRRTWCAESFAAAGVAFAPVQASLSTNLRAHTLRGLHWQADPHGEAKLVRCVAGAIWDVAVDMRPSSPTFRRWHAVRLDAEGARALLLPPDVAHGFLTLDAGAAVSYLIEGAYDPTSARGARWDDPALAIDWPARPAVLSERDATWPDLPDA
jgi:dTDP-4-dehydrorhamnose 3,5-epimerase